MNPILTEQEQIWFAELTKDRANTVKVLKKAGLIDIFVSHIVDTYRETAHFIYELLQNADDVNATKARFYLKEDGILFAHNGSIDFSISEPDIEREVENPGHLNAITTFSLSSKKEEIENKIGKFGIGFKSVFQYTDTPHVFNPPYNFRIEEYMIPRKIDSATELFELGETTVFWLPFDKNDKPKEEAYKEISEKISQLQNPLLFLNNLTDIEIQINGKHKTFSKNTEKEKLLLLPDIEIFNIQLDNHRIIKFDQSVAITTKENKKTIFPVNVAFVLDEYNNISNDEKYRHFFQNIWCFFPTYQTTHLNYIINAPFILTPNREALKEGRTENNQLLSAIGTLMESAIQGLKQLGYINEHFYTTITDPVNIPIEFQSIGNKILNKLRAGEFVPTQEGDYISISNAFVCTEKSLAELLSYNAYKPLIILTGKKNARIVFRERKLFRNSDQFVFIYKNFSATKAELQANWLGAQFKTAILENMPNEFIIMFFRYLAEHSSTILGKYQSLWKKNFVPAIDGSGDFGIVSPNNFKGEPQVYLGGRKIKGRYIIADYLKNEEDINEFLIHTLHFTFPDDFDDFLVSLNKYKEPESVSRSEVYEDTATIFKYFSEISQHKKEKLLNELKGLNFLPTLEDDGSQGLFNPFKNVIYYPSEELKNYFKKSQKIKTWLDLNFTTDEHKNEEIKSICHELKIEFKPYYFTDKKDLDGLSDFLIDISLSDSVYLAEILIDKQNIINLKKELKLLHDTKWLFNSSGAKAKPSEIKLNDLHEKYPSEFDSLHLSLGAIVDQQPDRYANLNELEKNLLQILAPTLEEITADDLKSIIAEYLKKKKAEKNESNRKEDEGKDTKSNSPEDLLESWTSDPLKNVKIKNEKDFLLGNKIPTLPNTFDFWKDNESEYEPENPGGFISAPVIGNQYKEEQEKRKRKQLEKEIELESKRNQLIELAHQLEPYSFGWFKTLLELEDNFTTEDRVKRNPVRVIFSKAEMDENHLLILSETPYIPPNIEDIGEISVRLYFNDEKRTIVGEVVSPKRQTLKIKLTNPDVLNSIDLSKITRAIVEASSPDFILEKLKLAFSRLPFEDTDNLKNPAIIPSNLNFVFGPPGTGKTTYLSWLIGGKNSQPLYFDETPILPLMNDNNNKVLVLTPTNKAADVLTEKILTNYAVHNDYPDWLIRFGQTGTLEKEALFIGDGIVKPWIFNKCTLVTTIARFPYDKLKIDRKGQEQDEWYLKDFNWDYIIFDEASMIQQTAILYVIFYSRQINPQVKFYIGGDPFQIPPIIQFEFPYWSFLPDPAFDNQGNAILDENGKQLAWKQDGGNIYAFTGLMKDDSFSAPETEPHKFAIHNLDTQFRSLPQVGSLFSSYRYGGCLKHYRNHSNVISIPKLMEKEFNIKGLPLKALNIIRFPVKKYEGIYRSRSVKGSPYQMYAAIFTVELLKYIQNNFTLEGKQSYRIGVISPYATQNTIITKLMEKTVSGPIEIIAGTVHGFQGDECDLVMVILNPPRNITRSPRSFLNKKNILNVAISRARDKMILFVPHDPENEVNVHDLHQIKWIEHLAGTLPECKNNIQGYLSTEIEKYLWGSDTYIEDISFPTSHQNVNIYTLANSHYEIRHDENAIDIQVKTE